MIVIKKMMPIFEYKGRKREIGEEYKPPIANKVIQAIKLLQGWVTIVELEEALEISKKGVHRYLNMLVSFGFVIRSKGRGRFNIYHISNTKKFFGIK